MKYILSQDKSTYSAWQVQAAVGSLLDLGVNREDIFILLGSYGYNKHWKRIERRFKGVNFFQVRQESPMSYLPALKPYLLWKFFEAFPYLEKEQWMLLDCDVVLTELIEPLPKGRVYGSNCISYLGYEYLESKGTIYANEMAHIVGVDVETIKNNNLNSAGAQFIFDNIPAKLWKKAWKDSLSIFTRICTLDRLQPVEDPTSRLQVWTAEMWAVLYNFWFFGFDTLVVDELDFYFATDKYDKNKDIRILHNAGVTSKHKGLFNKGDYKKTYPPKDLKIKKGTVSSKYYQIVKKHI